MATYTDNDFRDFGADQVDKCEDGFSLDCLATFEYDGEIIVNPYAYSDNPALLFGADTMLAWKTEAAALMTEWTEGNA